YTFCYAIHSEGIDRSTSLMHTNETKDRFIELRAQGHSLAKVALDLNVSKRTLVDWNHEFQKQIRQLRAIELEAVYAKILASREKELAWMLNIEAKMATSLIKRDFDFDKTATLLRFFLQYRRDISQMRSELMAPLEQAAQADPDQLVPTQDSQA